MKKSFITIVATNEQFNNSDSTGSIQTPDESQLMQTIDAGNEVDNLADMADTSASAQTQLNDLAMYVESAEKRGGMSPAMAQVVEFTHECIISRLGYTAKGKNPTITRVVPSLEGFKNEATRKKETHYTAESIKERASQIGARAKEIILKMWEKIKEIFNTMFSGRDESQLVNAIKAIDSYIKRAKAQTDTSSTVRAKEIFNDFETAVTAFKIGEGALTLATAALGASATTRAIKSGDLDIPDTLDDDIKEVHDMIQATSSDTGEVAVMSTAQLSQLNKEALDFLTKVRYFSDTSIEALGPVIKQNAQNSHNLSDDDAQKMADDIIKDILRKQTEVAREVCGPLIRLTRSYVAYANACLKTMDVK